MKLAISRWLYTENNLEKMPETIEELKWCMADLRAVLLKECDWTVGIDSPLTQEAKDEWLNWRQWMRDITQHINITEVVQYVDILDPPTIACPKTWVNVTFVESE